MKTFAQRKKRAGISIDFINAMIEKASPHRAPVLKTTKHYTVHVRTTENWLARGVINAKGLHVGYQIIDWRKTRRRAALELRWTQRGRRGGLKLPVEMRSAR